MLSRAGVLHQMHLAHRAQPSRFVRRTFDRLIPKVVKDCRVDQLLGDIKEVVIQQCPHRSNRSSEFVWGVSMRRSPRLFDVLDGWSSALEGAVADTLLDGRSVTDMSLFRGPAKVD